MPYNESQDAKKVVLVRSVPLNPETRLEKFSSSLSRVGYTVSLVGWNRHGTLPVFEKCDEYDIWRIGPKSPFGIKSVIFWPFWMISLFYWLIRHKCSVIHVADFPSLVPALVASKLLRVKIIYDIFDFYPDLMQLPKLLHWMFSNIEFALMKLVDEIIIVDSCRYSQIKKSPDSENVTVIYNTPNDIMSSQLVSRSMSGNMGAVNVQKHQNDMLNVFYCGAMYCDRDVLSFVQLAKNDSDIKLTLGGSGDDYIINTIQKYQSECPNISYIGTIPYEETLLRSKKADILFALYNPEIPNNRLASPNKLFEAMMCGKPIIVNEGVATADKVREENCGLVIPYSDYEALKEAVLLLKNNPELRKELGENGRRAYDTKYNWKIMEKRLLDLYASLEEKQ